MLVEVNQKNQENQTNPGSDTFTSAYLLKPVINMNRIECENLSEELANIQDQRSKIQDRVFRLLGVNSVKSVNSVSVEMLSKTRETHRLVKELRGKVTELADEYLLVIKGKNEEGKEVVMDLGQELFNAEVFYSSHNLQVLADALPGRIKYKREIRTRILEAMKEGMDRVLVCADIETQESIPLTTYKEELADKPVPRLPADDPNQYTPSYMEPGVEQATVTPKEKAVRKGAYLLFYSTKPVPPESKNLTYEKAEEWLAENKKNGLTLQELYAIQLKEFLAEWSHDLIAHNSTAEKSNWTWCIASRLPAGQAGAPGGCVSAIWSAVSRRVYVRWHYSVCSDGFLGARPAVVVPL